MEWVLLSSPFYRSWNKNRELKFFKNVTVTKTDTFGKLIVVLLTSLQWQSLVFTISGKYGAFLWQYNQNTIKELESPKNWWD